MICWKVKDILESEDKQTMWNVSQEYIRWQNYMTKVRLDAKSAKAIWESAGNLTEKKNIGLFDDGEKKATAVMIIRIPSEVYRRFFPDTSLKEVAGIVEQALEAWLDGKETVAHV